MSKFAHQEYDSIVCGAGPAGLMAACTLGKSASGFKKILILDKKEPWKEPIFCAEAVSRSQLARLWPVSDNFVRGGLSGIYFTSPKGYRAEFYSKDCGLLLNRAKFHHALADAAVESGVEAHFDVRVQSLDYKDGLWKVVCVTADGPVTLSAKTVVDGTGPGARLTNGLPWVDGIESGDTDLEPAIFAVAEGIPHSREHIELFFGSEFPAGYGWIFPRDGVEVNIGFVLGKDAGLQVPVRQKLIDFINTKYPEAKVKAIYGGKIACGQTTKPLAKCGLFKAGDAASCVNPISRSGIVESLCCGKIVGEAVLQWLGTESPMARKNIEDQVLDRWMEAYGKSHMQIAKAKPGFAKIKDSQFDKAAAKLSKLPKEKQTLFRIFWAVLSSSPSIIWKMRSFLG